MLKLVNLKEGYTRFEVDLEWNPEIKLKIVKCPLKVMFYIGIFIIHLEIAYNFPLIIIVLIECEFTFTKIIMIRLFISYFKGEQFIFDVELLLCNFLL